MLLPDLTGGTTADLPIRRATVDQIVAHRNRALTLYGEAHAAIANASAALEAAQEEALKASPGETRFNYHLKIDEASFIGSIKVPDRADFMSSARKIVDTNVWSYVIQITDLERLMDKKAKDELYQQLITDVPEATVENICATLEKFMLEAGTIWKRGIAECFSNLDRRFRSHDGWKIGSRIILDYAFDRESGHWNWHRDQGATMLDVERVFRMLDRGMHAAQGYGIQYKIDLARRNGYGPRQTTVETEYFRVRIFKNGNAHIWFLRDDLVDRVNQLLGEYYGAPIPEEREPDEDTGLNHLKTAPAKRYGFFPTPDAVADRVIRVAPLYRGPDEPALTVLEPSAGTGNLARRCATFVRHEWGDKAKERVSRSLAHQVDCVEIQPDLADSLRAEGIYRKVYGCDFLSLSPETTGLYDRVVMNPPFDRERDIDHVMHALGFLKPNGCLVAIMSAGTEFRETRKSIAFRGLMKSMGARFDDLPTGSFASVGTYCNTIVLKVWKDGRSQNWDSEVRRRFE
jgi:hypothetical protein